MLTKDEDTFCEGNLIFEKGICLSIFYCLCFVGDISANILETQATEEIYPDLEGEEDFRISDDRGVALEGS